MPERLQISELEIDSGWRVSDLLTLADCDEAHLTITRGIVSIDAQLDEFERDSDLGAQVTDDDADWHRRARAARRIKGTLLQLVQSRRAEIARAMRQATSTTRDRALITLIKARHPEAFAAAVAELESSPAGVAA